MRTKEWIEFRKYLERMERSTGTIEKYLRDVRHFASWLGRREVTKERTIEWRNELLKKGYAPVTVNSMIASINSYFYFIGWADYKVQYLKIQRKLFRELSKELERKEYNRLLEISRTKGRERLALLIETICATGIRVSEVKYITVEAVRRNRAEIILKGKIRTILLPNKLCRKLLKYAHKKKIGTGEIFITNRGKGISRKQIWSEMKAMGKASGIELTKVFPHNLRHLFARVFYHTYKDVAKLADILGHTSIETTRIYLLTTGTEHLRQMDGLRLVS